MAPDLFRNETVVCTEKKHLAVFDTVSAAQPAPMRSIAVRGGGFDKSQRSPGEIFEVLGKSA
jgi:hypothetical protein